MHKAKLSSIKKTNIYSTSGIASFRLLRSSLFISLIVSLVMSSCEGDTSEVSKKVRKSTDSLTHRQKSETPIKPNDENIQSNTTATEAMTEKDILLNGRLKRYFSLNEFKSVIGEPDSTQLLTEIEPCTNIFQEADGSVDPETKYLYKNGSRFECVGGKVAIDEIRFEKSDFLVFKNHTLDKNTTTANLRKIFPNAAKHIGVMDVAGEGQLQVMQLREDDNNISDGHINLFIKNGKLYFIHWWFPC